MNAEVAGAAPASLESELIQERNVGLRPVLGSIPRPVETEVELCHAACISR